MNKREKGGNVCNSEWKDKHVKKKFKAFVRLKKRNRLNYYFLFIPFWELYLKL